MNERYEETMARLKADALKQLEKHRSENDRDALFCFRSRCMSMALIDHVINGVDTVTRFNEIIKELTK